MCQKELRPLWNPPRNRKKCSHTRCVPTLFAVIVRTPPTAKPIPVLPLAAMLPIPIYAFHISGQLYMIFALTLLHISYIIKMRIGGVEY